MATALGGLTFTAASAAVITKGRGFALVGLTFPAAVDNSAAKAGFEASFDGGTTYVKVQTDVSGTATDYEPAFVVSTLLVLDPTVVYALQEASHIRVTLYAADGSTAASQTSTTLGLAMSAVGPR